jgi:hypothetical protein
MASIRGGSRSIRECNEQVSVAAPEWMKISSRWGRTVARKHHSMRSLRRLRSGGDATKRNDHDHEVGRSIS